MKKTWFVGLVCLALLWAAPARAAKAGLTIKGGTLGIGVDATASLAPRLNARGNFNFFKYSFSGTQSGVKYDVDLKLRSFAILLDLHPAPGSGFRLSGGLLFNKNRLDMVSDQLTGTYTIGSKTYTVAQVGKLNGGGKLRRPRPTWASDGAMRRAGASGLPLTWAWGSRGLPTCP